MSELARVVSRVACAIAVAVAVQLHAQDIATGAHVRVARIDARAPLEGALIARTPDSLTLGIDADAGIVVLPMDSIRSIDVDQGFRASHRAVVKSALIGAAVGAAAGVTLAQTKCSNRKADDNGPSCPLENLVFTVPLTIAGALFGVFVARKNDKVQWNRVFDRERGTALLLGPTAHHGFAAEIEIHFGTGAGQQ